MRFAALAAMGRTADARVALEEALRLDPANHTARSQLEQLPAGG